MNSNTHAALLRKVVLGVTLTVALLAVLAVSARAALLGDVNKALRAAGIPVTGKNQLGWGEGVITGHYTSYQQLVDAMKFHKAQGKSIPDSSKFTKAVASGKKLRCFEGGVISFSPKAWREEHLVKGKLVTTSWSFSQKLYDQAVSRSLSAGSRARTCVDETKKRVVSIKNLAPAGLEATYGTTNAGGGGGT